MFVGQQCYHINIEYMLNQRIAHISHMVCNTGGLEQIILALYYLLGWFERPLFFLESSSHYKSLNKHTI